MSFVMTQPDSPAAAGESHRVGLIMAAVAAAADEVSAPTAVHLATHAQMQQMSAQANTIAAG